MQTRPSRRAVMRQRWDDLLFLHWAMDPEIIQRTLPPGLFVDCYDGKAYVAVVPFKMRAIRPAGLPPVPYLSNFLESNVRTYVHDRNGVPGVWFYSLDTDRWVAHWIAKQFFHLPYVWSKMANHGFSYGVERRDSERQSAHYAFEPQGPLGAADPGSLDFFLLERYLLYSYARKTKQLFKGQVHHLPYQYSNLSLSSWDTLPLSWNDLPAPTTAPVHQCYSPGVAVDVFPITAV